MRGDTDTAPLKLFHARDIYDVQDIMGYHLRVIIIRY